MSWRDHGDHPNSGGPLRYRHGQLTRAAKPFKARTRVGVIVHHARGQKVLDLGCVAHNFEFHQARGSQGWLHQHVVDAAAECVGADYDEVGVKQMREAGFDVVQVDILGDLTPILERGPFDVVVAGELIEHLPSPQGLLSAAAQVLKPGGKLVLTTPNPYSPRRVRAGQTGQTWENVDHIIYAFPSGMAEMADRTGLRLSRFGTVGWPYEESLLKELWTSTRTSATAWLRRRRGRRNNLAGPGRQLPLPVTWQSPLDLLTIAVRGRRMTGETAVYVLRKPVARDS